MPASVALGINLLDTAVHSWDVARCTGQDTNLPDTVALAAHACAKQIVSDEIRGFAGFAPAVSTGPGRVADRSARRLSRSHTVMSEAG